jgi:Putative peptidoglycan binding domain
MRTLKKGSTGPEVGLLRRLLNRKMLPSPNLPEANVFGARYNGAMGRIDFGPQMDTAVKTFQRSKRLKDDGIVGPLTWGALGLTLDVNQVVIPASQSTNDTCYAAAATMVLGPSASMSFNPGPTPPGVAADDHWARSFSRLFSWQLEYGMTPMPSALVSFLHHGPFWFAGNLPFPGGPSYHAVVVGAIWGDGGLDRTMLLIYDPWPVKVGEVYGIILGDYLSISPLAFRYILHR